MKYKSTFVYFILFILIGIASIFILHHGKQTEKRLLQKTTLNTFVHDATFTEYDKQGLVKTKITAEKITHYQPQGTSVFEKPFIITYSDDRRPWHIRADQATSDRTGQTIVLSGHVIAREVPTAQHAGTTITTTQITIYPKTSRVDTDKPVVLTQPGTVIHGTGFTANLKTGQYQLHSESEAIYQPEQKKHHTP